MEGPAFGNLIFGGEDRIKLRKCSRRKEWESL